MNNYYNSAVNPRFMIENDEKFRLRIERIKGLNAYNAPPNEYAMKQSTADQRVTKQTSKSKLKKIVNAQGKSSMNYKFRAFKKSNQPNSFVQTEQQQQQQPAHQRIDRRVMRTNVHVNDEDIYIDQRMNVDMNELINGLV